MDERLSKILYDMTGKEELDLRDAAVLGSLATIFKLSGVNTLLDLGCKLLMATKPLKASKLIKR